MRLGVTIVHCDGSLTAIYYKQASAALLAGTAALVVHCPLD